MRDAAFACIRRVGVETGGSNVQFAINPDDGHMVVIEMNPRVSRSSALASKATGFPIAKIAAKLAVGYTLDEIPNDITKATPASFEPDHRLRGHQGAPLGLREVPRHHRGARHLHAVGGGGHGHRSHLPRVAPEGDALPRARPSRPRLRPRRVGLRRPRRRGPPPPGRHRHAGSALPARGRPPTGHQRRDPGRSHQGRSLVPRPDPHHHRGAPRAGRPRLRRHGPGRAGAGPSGSASAMPSWRGSGGCPRPR